MSEKPFIARGFAGRRAVAHPGRIPPGQYETREFPVLSAGPTPRTPLTSWDFSVEGPAGLLTRWSWDEFQALPRETPIVDIHCVTKWSKLDTIWEGVSVDTLLAAAQPHDRVTWEYMLAVCDGGYTTNLRFDDVVGGKAWIVFGYDGAPLAPEHGGPARLLVPHLYFWKSAKWVRRLKLLPDDDPGFWERLGYHNRGDPWREQRYQGDP